MSDLTLALGALTGGASGALDAIDGAGLSDGDAAIVVLSTGTYWYHLNASSGASENSPFRIVPDSNPGTKVWHLVGTTARIGALVKRVSGDGNVTITTANNDFLEFPNEEYDDASFHDNSINPSRLTIPIGVTCVELAANVRWEGNSTGYRVLSIWKNQDRTVGFGLPYEQLPASGNCELNVKSGIVEVSATDYFETYIRQTSGGDLDIDVNAATSSNWFSIRAVGFA